MTVELEHFLPPDLQVKAAMHFTPPVLARRIAKLLAPEPGTAVLDIGAGPGLFCVAAALVFEQVEFVGVEQRPRLVGVANYLARCARVANTTFIHGDALELDWSAYAAFYLYNPFAELVMGNAFILDRDVLLDPTHYQRCIDGVLDKLDRAPAGTRVATYHGFGGDLSATYELSHTEAHGCDRVELWIKR